MLLFVKDPSSVSTKRGDSHSSLLSPALFKLRGRLEFRFSNSEVFPHNFELISNRKNEWVIISKIDLSQTLEPSDLL